jgi:hypothetical protein
MRRKFRPRPHTINDPIVVRALKAINLVKSTNNVEGHIGGGMAVGAYIPVEEQRPTIDLDFALLWGGTTSEFRRLMEPLISTLKAEGYDLRIQKGDKTYDIPIQSDTKDSLLVQHHRRNQRNFQKNKKSLERETANQRVITGDDISFAVMSPEDLILHKLSRLFTFSKIYGILIPQKMKTEDMARTIRFLREDYDAVQKKEVATVRMYHDSYDIKHLAGNVGLNKRYFEEAAKDWNTKYMNEDSAKTLLERMGVELK